MLEEVLGLQNLEYCKWRPRNSDVARTKMESMVREERARRKVEENGEKRNVGMGEGPEDGGGGGGGGGGGRRLCS